MKNKHECNFTWTKLFEVGTTTDCNMATVFDDDGTADALAIMYDEISTDGTVAWYKEIELPNGEYEYIVEIGQEEFLETPEKWLRIK